MSDRRTFVKMAGLAAGLASTLKAAAPTAQAATPTLAPSTVDGANDRIRIALIGCGGQGRYDLMSALATDKVQCVGLCDVDDDQTAEADRMHSERVGVSVAMVTRDFRRILDRNDVDAVIVATPDHWHALITTMACQSGKDVYVEKPLSTSIHEGRVMVNVARRYERVVQMGTQQRSAPHYADAVEFVRSGQLGRIRLVRAWAYLDWKSNVPVVPDCDPPEQLDYEMWLGPAPERPYNKYSVIFNFRWFWDYSGGLMTDWGAHMIDVANWAMGVKAPVAASSMGGRFGYPNGAMQTPDTQQVLWEFPDFGMVWEHAVGLGRGPEAREHGVEFHGNNGVLVVDRGGWEVYPETRRSAGEPREYNMAGIPRQDAGGVNYHVTHVRNFLDCMRTRKRPTSDVEIGHNSMIACHLGNIAYRLRRRVTWDAEAERISGDEEAQSLVGRKYRAPWRLPA